MTPMPINTSSPMIAVMRLTPLLPCRVKTRRRPHA
jgi:hypothetical protein